MASSKLVVWEESYVGKKSVIIPSKEISGFKLQYAKTKNYWWIIPVFTLATALHGLYLIGSATVNIVFTTTVAISGKNTYQYSDMQGTYRELKKFARFPQGIQSNIDLASIE